MFDKRDPNYWLAIKPQSNIILTDEQALQENPSGQEYVVDRVIKVHEKGNVCDWLFFELSGVDGAPNLILVVKIVGTQLDLRAYFESDGFEIGDRADMIASERFWLFQEPANPENFQVLDLKYTKHVGWDFPNGEGILHADYNAKIGELQGSVTYIPRDENQESHLATVVEFASADDVPWQEMILLEIGNARNKNGGLVRMMFGNNIRPTEVEVLAVTN